MATLKSLKNKYLQRSDGAALGVDQNTDNVSLFAFKVAAAGSIAKFDMRDGFYDDYQDGSGIDTSASTNDTRDSSGKYYSGSTVSNATGGTITSYTSGSTTYKVHTFTSDGTFTVPTGGVTVDYLIVAGGGSGGGGGGAGGGAGGLIHSTSQSLSAGSFPAVVGAGGAAKSGSATGNSGANSTFNSQTAVGGGGGGGGGNAGASGGSGGGGAGNSSNQPGGSATAGQGNSGGSGFFSSGSSQAGGGGGGAGGAGGNASGPRGQAGAGGAGVQKDITGTNTYYSAGGGGSTYFTWDGSGSQSAGAGGTGGGGAGGADSSAGSAGTTYGSGGGGGASNAGPVNQNSGAGASGVVIVRYVEDSIVSYSNMTLVSNAQTAQAQPSTSDVVLKYTNGAGTATINTDLKVYVSRDNGTTYTQGTLVSEGTTGSDTILAARRIDISGQPAGTSMRYKIETLNQSVSKQTRLQAVSLAWA